jgi:general secretion pathway protein A
MYSDFFKMRMNPFSETPDTRFFFKSESHVAALDSAVSAIRDGKGFTLITGEVGVGKTILSRVLLNFLNKRTPTALVLNPVLNQHDLLTTIREEFKLEAPKEPGLKGEYDQISKFLIETAQAKKRTVLIIDEAQKLTFEGLEAVRLLSNLETEERKLLQIILIGQPELESRLEQFELRQLSQRINVRAKLAPMPALRVDAYIRHRVEISGGTNFVRFDEEACAVLTKLSSGVPRVINFLCERVIAQAEKQKVRLISAEFVLSLQPVRPKRSWKDIFNLGKGPDL